MVYDARYWREQAVLCLQIARELSDRLHITGGAGGAIVTLEFELAATTRRDTPGLASAARPGEPARR